MGVFSLWKGTEEQCTHNVSILYIQRLLLKILFKKKERKRKKKEILGSKGKGKATHYTLKIKI